MKLLINLVYETYNGAAETVNLIKSYVFTTKANLIDIEAISTVFYNRHKGGNVCITCVGTNQSLLDEAMDFISEFQKVNRDPFETAYTDHFNQINPVGLKVFNTDMKSGINIVFDVQPGDFDRFKLALTLME